MTRTALSALMVAAFWGCGGAENGAGGIEHGPGETTTGESLSRGELFSLPSFSLTDQNGERFGSPQLDGHVWVANFIFTRCRGVCPVMTAQFGRVQDALRDTPAWDEVRLVSISVDPEHDTPAVLAEYAGNAKADTGRWKFLTGTVNQVWQLSRHGFKLPVGDAPDDEAMPIFHSQSMVLVDRDGWVRGLYDGLDNAEREALVAKIREVVAEPPIPRIPFPEEIIDPPWLARREQAQLATRDRFEVFHGFRFEDRLHDSGITFVNRATDDSGKAYKPVHYDHGNGLAVADVDGDGWLDLYFPNQLGSNELWRNIGNGEFENITRQAGVGLAGKISVSASFGDLDNDGDADLYVTTVRGGNHLFANDGSGAFRDVTARSGLGHVGHSSAAVLFDYNRDGLLDVFLCNVGVYTTDELGPGGYHVGVADAFAGHLKPAERNERSLLFENRGDLRFRDVTEQRRLLDESWTGEATPIDFNEDGWPDLYVANMQGHDEYYENVEGKRFEKKSRDVFPRTPWGSMSVKVFDYDNDADMDIILSDMHSDMSENIGIEREKLKSRMQWPESLLQSGGMSIFGNGFFRNDGNGRFSEVSDQLGTENYWPWGLSVGDLNADGFDDVFIASSMNFGFRYAVNTVLLNNRGERFLDSEFILGVEPRRDRRTARPWFKLDCLNADLGNRYCEEHNLIGEAVFWGAVGSRSSAIFDLDADGDLDIVTNEFHDGPMVLVSNLAQRRAINRLEVRLTGTESNRDGLGALVTVHAGGARYVKVHDGQSGYLSQSLIPLYFGLDGATRVDRLEIAWPSGKLQALDGPIAVDEPLEIIEE